MREGCNPIWFCNTKHRYHLTYHASRITHHKRAMPVVAVVGCQWGDEGKGKIVDLLAEQAQVVARCNGGSNAGHTIVNELGTFKLRLVPSGIFNSQAVSIIGNGVVVDLDVLLEEIEK